MLHLVKGSVTYCYTLSKVALLTDTNISQVSNVIYGGHCNCQQVTILTQIASHSFNHALMTMLGQQLMTHKLTAINHFGRSRCQGRWPDTCTLMRRCATSICVSVGHTNTVRSVICKNVRSNNRTSHLMVSGKTPGFTLSPL